MNLEKLGQYLRHEPLQTCLTAEGSEWASMLSENKCLHDHPLIVKQDLGSSLLQTHAKLVEAVALVFSEAYQSLVSYFVITSISLTPFKSSQETQIVTSDEDLLIASADVERRLLRFVKIQSTNDEPKLLTFKDATVSINARNGKYTQKCHKLYLVMFEYPLNLIFISLIIQNLKISYSENFRISNLQNSKFYNISPNN